MSRTTGAAEVSQDVFGPDTYDNIEPWFEKLAALAADDPHRSKLRTEIVERCLPLAEHIARKFAGRGEDFDDLLQVARLGLVQAVDRFDVSRGASFLSFAVPTVMGSVRRHFRDGTWALRVPRRAKEIQAQIRPAIETLSQRLGRMPTAREIAAELDLEVVEVTQALMASNAYQTNSLDAVAGPSDEQTRPSIADTLGREEPSYRLLEDALAVRPLLAALPDRERQVLVMRFFENRTQAQIAERLGVSQMQVSRILTRTLKNLREQALAEPAARRIA
ncbi:RNA polymerase sigma factor SigF [Nocardia arizonensis]|uniref:RNA polymerase sigma factor SigF n=1 Tax=Nocardia arizonensis TaxID=1141647 RepID=UPI0006D2ACF3|nr:RNA polymerase sigma factor SigF [Nocardia arizonensis]